MPIRLCCTFMRPWPRGTALDIRTDQGRTDGKKGSRAVLGNCVNLAQAGSLGRVTLIESADDFAQSLMLPALRAIRSEGATTLRSISQALNRQGIKSPRGGTWYPSSVSNLLSRSNSFL